jgi:flagellar hook-associated protein 2
LAVADIVVQGVAERMQGVLEGYTRLSTGILDTRFSTITSQLIGLQSDIEDFDQSIQEREGELIREFATLETALGQLQIESRFLTAQLTALQNTLTGSRNRRNNNNR